MDHKAIKEDITVIAGLLDEWREKNGISLLEYDLLLDKIKSLYEAVKFCGKHIGHAKTAEPVEDTLPLSAPQPAVNAITPTAEVVHDVDAICSHEIETVKEEPLSKAEIHRRTVYALYADDKEDTGENPQQAPVISDSLQPDMAVSETQRQTLAETICSQGRTLADSLYIPTSDIASKIGKERIVSLRQSIGLNDRYMFVRELFDGDVAAFDTAITKLDEFTDIDDALLYIHDTYSWTGSNKAAVSLVDMLAKKLM